MNFSSNISRLFFDTNIYILGSQDPDSFEAIILRAIGFYETEEREIEAEIIFSDALIDQIRRVGKYLWGKDRAGFILGTIWSNLNIHYVVPDLQWYEQLQELKINKNIPTEDILIYLTAKYGKADRFVSGNRELISAIADFPSLTPEDFVRQYILSL